MADIKTEFETQTDKAANNAQSDRLGGSAHRALRRVQGQLSYIRRPAVLYLTSGALGYFLKSDPGKDFLAGSWNKYFDMLDELAACSERAVDYLDRLSADDVDELICDMSDMFGHVERYCAQRLQRDPYDLETNRVMPLIRATVNFLDMTRRTTDRFYKNDSNIIEAVVADPYVAARFVAELMTPLAEEFEGHSYRDMLLSRRAKLLYHCRGCENAQNLSGVNRREMMSLLKNTSEMFAEICMSKACEQRFPRAEEQAGFLSDITTAYDWKQFEVPAAKAQESLPEKTMVLTIKRPGAPRL